MKNKNLLTASILTATLISTPVSADIRSKSKQKSEVIQKLEEMKNVINIICEKSGNFKKDCNAYIRQIGSDVAGEAGKICKNKGTECLNTELLRIMEKNYEKTLNGAKAQMSDSI